MNRQNEGVLNKPRGHPTPGHETKARSLPATKITARFKNSQNPCADDNIHACMRARRPEPIIYGKPYLLDAVATAYERGAGIRRVMPAPGSL